jgi:hypothetical protein
VSVLYAVTAGGVLRGQAAGLSHFALGRRAVVSWQEAGHSCLLISADLPASQLLAIARS